MGIILAIDDNGGTLRMIKKMLEDDYRVILASSGKRALESFRKTKPDLILLDVMMPEMDGFETFGEIRRIEDAEGLTNTPVIFLTGENDTEVEQKGLKLGAADFIRKPLNEEILKKRIQNTIENDATIKNLTEEVAVDKLTGFLNKSSGVTKISIMCKKSVGSLMIMDLDNFKLVNDLFGHDMGDKILRAFSDIVRSNIRKSDVIARIGGDEFLGFFVGITEEAAMDSLAKRLNQQLVAEARNLMGEDNGIPLGISIGAAVVPNYGRDYKSLFSLADNALYIAKQNGKHGYSTPKIKETEEDISNNLDDEIDRISKIVEERNEKGALLLGRESFSVVSHFIMRFYKRYGGNIVKILFSLSARDGSDVGALPSQFGNILQKSLRNSDLILQSRSNQFFVLLTGKTGFQVKSVIDRVLQRWAEYEYSGDAIIDYAFKTFEYTGIKS